MTIFEFLFAQNLSKWVYLLTLMAVEPQANAVQTGVSVAFLAA